METITITTEYIKLQDLLKLAAVTATGATSSRRFTESDRSNVTPLGVAARLASHNKNVPTTKKKRLRATGVMAMKHPCGCCSFCPASPASRRPESPKSQKALKRSPEALRATAAKAQCPIAGSSERRRSRDWRP